MLIEQLLCIMRSIQSSLHVTSVLFPRHGILIYLWEWSFTSVMVSKVMYSVHFLFVIVRACFLFIAQQFKRHYRQLVSFITWHMIHWWFGCALAWNEWNWGWKIGFASASYPRYAPGIFVRQIYRHFFSANYQHPLVLPCLALTLLTIPTLRCFVAIARKTISHIPVTHKWTWGAIRMQKLFNYDKQLHKWTQNVGRRAQLNLRIICKLFTSSLMIIFLSRRRTNQLEAQW